MDKFNSKAHVKTVLSDVVAIGYEHIQSLLLELKKYEITDSNIKEKSQHELNQAQLLTHVLTVVNDVIHPAHKLSLEMFPDAHEFIEFCMKNHKIAVDKKMVAQECKCYTCAVDNALKIKVEKSLNTTDEKQI